MLRARKVNQLMREIGKNNLDLFGMDLSQVKNYFAGNLASNSGRYLKTSSLIITFNDLLTTGGHNLSSRISRVNSMTHYKQSKGNYVPKDYERPAGNEPVLAENKPMTSQPSSSASPSTNAKPTTSGNTPSSSKPSSSSPSGSRPSSTAAPSGSKPSASTPSASKPSTTNSNAHPGATNVPQGSRSSSVSTSSSHSTSN